MEHKIEDIRKLKSRVEEQLERPELGLVKDEDIKTLAKAKLEKRLKWGYKPTYAEQLSNLLQFAQSLPSLKMENVDDQGSSKQWLYGVPSEFLQIIYGGIIKMSGSYYEDESTTLEESMIKDMDSCCEKANVKEGHSVLDIGCGYGSLIIHIAKKYRTCNVTGITNFVEQKQYIMEECKKLNLSNVEVIVGDGTTINLNTTTFDRVFVTGMLEEINDYKLFLKSVSDWMKPDGLLLVTHFCHKTFAYQNNKALDDEDWHNEYIFPSGNLIVPSASLLLYFQEDLSVVSHWATNGTHTGRTCKKLVERIDANIEKIKEIFSEFYGSKEDAIRMINYWRVLCITGAEMYTCKDGEEWMDVYYLFKKK